MKYGVAREVWFVYPESEEGRVYDYMFFNTKIEAERYARHLRDEEGVIPQDVPLDSGVRFRHVYSLEV